MPELPEVQTVVNDLKSSILSLKIKEVQISNKLIWRNNKPANSMVVNLRIADIVRKGKNILMHLSGDKTLIIHLKMTGKLIYTKKIVEYPKHTHFAVKLSSGYLYFNDVRRFGYLDLVKTEMLKNVEYLNKLGPDPFDLVKSEFVSIIKSKSRQIKPLLMDQHVISGLGNIYADESLFAAKINPKKISSSISNKKLEILFSAIIRILKQAIKAKGSSVSDYVDGSGNAGSFQFFHKVYGCEGAPCANCRTQIKRESIGGRSAHYCPRCQRL